MRKIKIKTINFEIIKTRPSFASHQGKKNVSDWPHDATKSILMTKAADAQRLPELKQAARGVLCNPPVSQ